METDWFELWRELVVANAHPHNSELAGRYESHARKRGERPDPLLNFVLKNTGNEITVLEIGAGSGRWTIPLGKIARSVTAIEPSDAMLGMLRENVASAKLKNVRIVQSSWEEATIEPHDIVVCSHAMYASPDLGFFVRKMEQCATKTCYLAMRLPPSDGIIGTLSLSIYGHPHDSPNAIIAYNALYSMGIYANVLVEDNIHSWVNSTTEEAFVRAKRHLRLESSTTYDRLIRDTLDKRLTLMDNSYVWPDGMRSALLWWHVRK